MKLVLGVKGDVLALLVLSIEVKKCQRGTKHVHFNFFGKFIDNDVLIGRSHIY